MIYGYQGHRLKAKRREMQKLMLRSVGVGVAVIGFGGIVVDGRTYAGWVIAAVGITLFILGKEANNG